MSIMSETEERQMLISADHLPVPRRSRGFFSYRRLRPTPLIRLSIIKLDGSCFGVEVTARAKVRELKAAVEQVFFWLSWNEGLPISWPHVWSQFCLSYKDQQLVDDKARIGLFGIKDGDQLCFMRCTSRTCNPAAEKRRRNTEIQLVKGLLCK